MNKKLLFVSAVLMLSFSISAISQITWTAPIDVANSSYGAFHPRIETDGAGNPLLIWTKQSNASVYFARWNGSSFTTPVKLNPTWLSVANGSWMGPDIAAKGDTIYVVMKRIPEASDTNHIYIVRSFNGGLTFSTPTRVDFIADSISRFPTVTINSSGNPLVAFMKFNSTFGDSRWVVTKSSDYGDTFTTDVEVSGWSGPTALVCDCCPGAVVSAGNKVAMLYRDNLNNIRDCWAGVSVDGGVSYTSGIDVDQNGWIIPACPASGPDGVIIGDSVYSVFLSGAGGSNRVYRSAASLSSMVSLPSQVLPDNIPGLTQQNYPRIGKHGSAVAIVWKQIVSGADQLPVLFTNNISNGFPLVYDTVDLGNITNADVALSNGNIYVAWEDDNSGVVKFRKGTYTPVTTSISEIANYGISLFPNPGNGKLNIISTGFISSVEVTDMTGRLVNEAKPYSESFSLNIEDNGMYFVRIIAGKQTIMRKIIVCR